MCALRARFCFSLDEIGSPVAGSAGRFAPLDPAFVRTSSRRRHQDGGETMYIIDEINELRAELQGCDLTAAERTAAEAQLAALIARQQARIAEFGEDIATHRALE
jgi:hypothetical protein